jgi:hypothetical protein
MAGSGPSGRCLKAVTQQDLAMFLNEDQKIATSRARLHRTHGYPTTGGARTMPVEVIKVPNSGD